MTDPELADRTYVEPLRPDIVEAIIARERPDALLPTVGGQTALNLAMALAKSGALERYGVELIGASVAAIDVAEDRLKFRDAMREIGRRRARERVRAVARRGGVAGQGHGFPSIIRPSFTLAGVGSGIAYNVEEFREIVRRGLAMSPVHEVLIEESLIGGRNTSWR